MNGFLSSEERPSVCKRWLDTNPSEFAWANAVKRFKNGGHQGPKVNHSV